MDISISVLMCVALNLLLWYFAYLVRLVVAAAHPRLLAALVSEGGQRAVESNSPASQQHSPTSMVDCYDYCYANNDFCLCQMTSFLFYRERA